MPRDSHPNAPRVRVYSLEAGRLRLSDMAGPTLDAVSLQLPEGVYTTLRVYDHNRVLGLSAHLQRLAESRGLAAGEPRLDLEALRAGMRQALACAALPSARLRVTVPFGGPAVYFSVEPFEPYPETYYTQGVACATAPMEREIPRAKRTRAIAIAQAARAARPAEAHEILRVDQAGRLLEGLSSNFFAVQGGRLHTAGEGVLLGVTRSVVLAEAAALLPVVEQAIRVADLTQVSEAFITSASREVMPVVRIDATSIGAGQPGPVAQALLQRYRARVHEAAEVV